MTDPTGHNVTFDPGDPPDLDLEIQDAYEVLLGTNQLLSEIRTLLERLLTVDRTGAVSSAELKYTAKGEAQPVIKAYAGSEVPVIEAVDAYELMITEANKRFVSNLQKTVDGLTR